MSDVARAADFQLSSGSFSEMLTLTDAPNGEGFALTRMSFGVLRGRRQAMASLLTMKVFFVQKKLGGFFKDGVYRIWLLYFELVQH